MQENTFSCLVVIVLYTTEKAKNTKVDVLIINKIRFFSSQNAARQLHTKPMQMNSTTQNILPLFPVFTVKYCEAT